MVSTWHTRAAVSAAGMPKRAGTECSPWRAVELDVLAGVDEVEAGDPHREREPEHEDRRRRRRPRTAIQPPARRDPVGEAEDPVREPGEALGVE